LLCLVLAAGCRGEGQAVPDRAVPRRSTAVAELAPQVPAGVRLVSFGAERDWAMTGALLEPPWCVQLSAEVRDARGAPAVGVPVTLRLDRRATPGRTLMAALSHDVALTDAAGRARALLVSSDAPGACRVWATCGPVSLGAAVEFTARRPADFTVGAAGPGERPLPLPPPDERVEARVARLMEVAAVATGAEAAAAREEVGCMGSAAVTPLLLIVFSEHRPPAVKRQAALVLSGVRDELVLDRLLAGLDDERAASRAGAEAALGTRGPDRAGPGVRRTVRLAGPFGRSSALRVLADWGRPEDLAVIASQAGADSDPLVRATAVWKLKAFTDRPEVRMALRAAASDDSAFVRYAAARALQLAPALAGSRPSTELAAGLLADPDPLVRAAAALAAGGPAYEERLLDLAADPALTVRCAAVRSLGRCLPSERSAARLRLLAAGRETGTADEALGALVRGGAPEDADLMLEALAGADRELAAAALDSLERCHLVELGRPFPGTGPAPALCEAWGRWVEACRDLSGRDRFWLAAERSDSLLRGEALLAMVRLSGSADAAARVRSRAAALGSDMLASGEAVVRGPAAAALWLLGRPGARERLLAEMSGPDWSARLAACRAAAALRDREVALGLVARLDDESAAIRDAALAALRAMDPVLFSGDASPAPGSELRTLWKRRAASLSIPAPGGPE
jgi:HEAT repeat protein